MHCGLEQALRTGFDYLDTQIAHCARDWVMDNGGAADLQVIWPRKDKASFFGASRLMYAAMQLALL